MLKHSFYYLAGYTENDWLGKVPTEPKHFLELVVGEIQEGNFGPWERLEVRRPGKLVATANKKLRLGGPPEYLYKVRVYGPKKDIKTIKELLENEYGKGFNRTDPKSMRKLLWDPVKE
jgi:hypothetical protein